MTKIDGLNLDRLNACFDNARVSGLRFIGVIVDIGLETPEIIINGEDNFEEKQFYYNLTYDNYLENKHAEGVRIIGFSCANSFHELEGLLTEQTKNIKLTNRTLLGGNDDE